MRASQQRLTKPPSECPAEDGQQDTASERRKPHHQATATHLTEGLDMRQGQTVGYVRVSSADQNLARQLETIG